MKESFSYGEQETDGSGLEQEKEESLSRAGSSSTPNSSQAKLNLGATILASRFAANTRRGARKVKDVEMPKLQKPEEPDFSAEPVED